MCAICRTLEVEASVPLDDRQQRQQVRQCLLQRLPPRPLRLLLHRHDVAHAGAAEEDDDVASAETGQVDYERGGELELSLVRQQAVRGLHAAVVGRLILREHH